MTLYSTEKMFVDSEISVGRDEHLWIVFSDFHRLQSNKIGRQLSLKGCKRRTSLSLHHNGAKWQRIFFQGTICL